MKITRLELKDYKSFESLVLDDLPSRVVLVGPNGSGKSSVLEAIATLKEFAATYNTNEGLYKRHIPLINITDTGWPNDIPTPVRSDRPTATISALFHFDEAETVITGADTASVSVQIERSTGAVTTSGLTDGVRKLFRHFDPTSGIGVIDYISPHRTFPIQQLTTQNSQAVGIEQQRTERIEFQKPNYDYQKFRNIKQYIISQELQDLSYNRPLIAESGSINVTSLRDSLALLRNIFHDFFGPKKLLGFREHNGEMQVAVQTLWGDHDIDQLSSGEKELFSIFVNLFRIRNLPSVILYDEPERHLNAGLETRIIPALDKLQSRNQIWMATHGIELIGSVPMVDIVALKREAGLSPPERFREDASKTDRVRVFEAMGAKVGLQLASNRVVFLEGKDSHADKRIIDKLAGPQLPGVLFVASGSSKGVMGAGTRASEIVTQASKEAAFFMVLDRDYRDDAGVAALEKRLKNRAMVWGCHEVENLLLESSILLKILRFNGVDEFQDQVGVTSSLLEAAKSLEARFVAQWAGYRLHSKLNPDDDEKEPKPTDESNLIRMAEGALKRATAAYSEATVKNQIAKARSEIQASYIAGTWRVVLPGKEILEAFQATYLQGVQLDTLKEQIVSEMVQSGHLPSEVQRLVERIKAL
jgi:predicted ATPase